MTGHQVLIAIQVDMERFGGGCRVAGFQGGSWVLVIKMV